MKIEDFYHLCCAAAALSNTTRLTVFGMASILPYLEEQGIRDRTMRTLRGLYITVGSKRLDAMIDWTLGESSSFSEYHGYCAKGLAINEIVLPSDWKDRARKFTGQLKGLEITAPHPHDDVIALLADGREMDYRMAASVLRLFPLDLAGLTSLGNKVDKKVGKLVQTSIRQFAEMYPEILGIETVIANEGQEVESEGSQSHPTI